MAIIARASITLAQTVDISGYYRFYKLQASTATKPAKPTSIATLPPSGWSDTEPSYTEGSTNSLYFVDLVTFSDNTFEYSDVSLSSSYEAAKQAYNKSLAAMDAVDNLEIGGRNLIREPSSYSATSNGLTFTYNPETGYITITGTNTKTDYAYVAYNFSKSVSNLKVTAGKQYTYTIEGNMPSTLYAQINGRNTSGTTYSLFRIVGTGATTSKVVTVPSNHNSNAALDSFFIGVLPEARAVNCSLRIKLEKGNKPTDWTPAPEDQEQGKNWYAECSTAAGTAAKVATITPETSNFTLQNGATVNVKFTIASTATAASLTLNVNNTGAKGIRFIYNGAYSTIWSNTNIFKANQTYQFIYDGTYWIAQIARNTDTYDRRQHNQYIMPLEAVAAGKLIAGTASGYKALAAGLTFDLSYPILYAGGALTANTQAYNNFESFPSVNPATTGTVQGLTKNKMVWLKGSLSGNSFSVASTNWLTCDTPITADGFYYIPLGMIANDSTAKMYFSSSDKLYAFVNGTFQRVDKGAAAIATATQQYFWHDTNGAHIGTVEGDGDSGYNSLWNSNGLLFRNSTNNLAAFTTSEIQFYDGTGNADSNIVARFGVNSIIGKTNDTHLDLAFNRMSIIDKNGTKFFDVKDLRDESGSVEVTETFYPNDVTELNGTYIIQLTFWAANTTYTVTPSASDITVTGRGGNNVYISRALNTGETVTVTYPTESDKIKAFTFGKRTTNYDEGAHSCALGYDVVASGIYSFVTGNYSQAIGRASTATGHSAIADGFASMANNFQTSADGFASAAFNQGTYAKGDCQTTMGKFNRIDYNNEFAFIVGNGSSSYARSDAFTVDWDGNVNASATFIAGAVKSYTPSWETNQTPVRYHCVVSAGICSFFFMGNGVAHSQGATICTLPEGARPKTQINAPFVKMSGNVVGVIQITTSGDVSVAFISNTTSTGRIYFNCSFPVV